MNYAGKSQKEMAEIVGVSAPAFNEWIKGKKMPRIDKVQKLADYFGILKSDLLEEKTSEKTSEKIYITTDIVIRMEKDKNFSELIQTLYKMNDEEIVFMLNTAKQFYEVKYK